MPGLTTALTALALSSSLVCAHLKAPYLLLHSNAHMVVLVYALVLFDVTGIYCNKLTSLLVLRCHAVYAPFSSRGADVAATDDELVSPLHCAAFQGGSLLHTGTIRTTASMLNYFSWCCALPWPVSVCAETHVVDMTKMIG